LAQVPPRRQDSRPREASLRRRFPRVACPRRKRVSQALDGKVIPLLYSTLLIAPNPTGCPQPVRIPPPIRQAIAPAPTGFSPHAVRISRNLIRFSAGLRPLNLRILRIRNPTAGAAVIFINFSEEGRGASCAKSSPSENFATRVETPNPCASWPERRHPFKRTAQPRKVRWPTLPRTILAMTALLAIRS
jgi:hypothetical protein